MEENLTMGRGAAGVVTVLGSVGLYFLFAGEVSAGEAIGCVITLAIVCPFAIAVARTGTVPMRIPVRGLASILWALGSIPADLWRVGRVLVAAIARAPAGSAGSIERIPFRFGAFDQADIGRRASVGLALSVAPNGVVLGMDRVEDELILHRLAGRSAGGDREWPR